MNGQPRIFIYEDNDTLEFLRTDSWTISWATYLLVYAVLTPETTHRLEIVSMVWNGQAYWLGDHPVVVRLKRDFPGITQPSSPYNAAIKLDDHASLWIKMKLL